MTISDSLEERRDYCRSQAKQAEQSAEQGSREMRAAYLHLAQSWLQLATEIDEVIEAFAAESAEPNARKSTPSR